MGDKKKHDGAVDPFKMLLEEALARKKERNDGQLCIDPSTVAQEKHLHQAAMQPPSRYM
jgi:hypothetical protein